MQSGRFSYKSGSVLKIVCYKASLCENFRQQTCKAFTGLSNRAQMVGGGVPFYLKFVAKLTHPLEKLRLRIDIARSVSAITPIEKSSVITNRKSTKSFLMSLQ